MISKLGGFFFFLVGGWDWNLLFRSKKPKSKKAPPVSVGLKAKDPAAGEGAASASGSGARDDDKFFDDDRGGGEGSGSVGGSREGDLEDASEVGQKRKRYITVVDQAGKKRKVVDVVSTAFFSLLVRPNPMRIELVPPRYSSRDRDA